MVQRGCGQFTDTLLIGWGWGERESASSTFWFHQVRGLPVCGRHVITFSHLEGVSISAKQLRHAQNIIFNP